MKKQGEPMATLMAFSTLAIVGISARHCMKKYSSGTVGGRPVLMRLFRHKHPWRIF